MFDMHFYGIWSHIIGGKIDSGGGNFTKNYWVGGAPNGSVGLQEPHLFFGGPYREIFWNTCTNGLWASNGKWCIDIL
jgi:hypothetical protein